MIKFTHILNCLKPLTLYFFDLNDDGVDEVIGFNGVFGGTAGVGLYILQKQKNNKYKNIAGIVNFYNSGGIKIMKEKINGFHIIKMEIRNDKKSKKLPYSIVEYPVSFRDGFYAAFKITK